MEKSSLSFTVEIEVPPASFEELLKYTYQNYVVPARERVTNVKQTFVEGTYILNFTFLDPEEKGSVEVEIKAGKPVQVAMTPSVPSVSQSTLDRLKGDLVVTLQFFEEYVRRSTLYFTWVEGREVVLEKPSFRRARLLERILFGNIFFLFIVVIAISIVLFLVIPGPFAGLVIVVFLLLAVLFSDRIFGVMADWNVTERNQKVYVFQYHLPPEVRQSFSQKFGREKLLHMKKEIYDRTLALGKPVEGETAREVMSKYGLDCQPENVVMKTVNVYQLVEETAERFNLPIPKIALANTMVPNAAASGPSPRHALVLITTGLLVQLKEDEILAVLGHELSHLKARDQVVISGIVTSEYLFRIYFLWQYLYYFGLPYLILVLSGLFFVFKFFEARADLDSAIHMGNPKILAEALRKIGFHRLGSEHVRAYRIQEWITWNPHPPIYFRVSRLEKYGEKPVQVKHTLIQSAKDCIHGFFAAF
jgi:heat shock protein HtpX